MECCFESQDAGTETNLAQPVHLHTEVAFVVRQSLEVIALDDTEVVWVLFE
jgi:hypothetical protein